MNFLRRKNISIFVGNGIGNQLFVYSYILFQFKRNNFRNLKVKILFTRNPRAWTPFYLEDLINLRRLDIEVGKAGGLRYLVRARIPQALVRLLRFPKGLLSLFRIIFESEVFIFEKKLVDPKNHSLIFASFISQSYIGPVEDFVLEDIESWLDGTAYPENWETASSGQYITLHFRRGDTVTKDFLKSRGLLKFEYYKNALDKIGKSINRVEQFKLAVITDDPLAAKHELKNLNVDLWLGPQELNAIQAIKFASNSKFFIGSNSTFSWWIGKILIYNKRGEVYLPTPWYANLDNRVDKSLYIANANYVGWSQ